MKYRKNEAKEYAKEKLQGVWTALPTVFTDDDKVDDAGNRFNLEHRISKLKIEGHYCLGNVAEFWSMTNEERMRVHEINAETAAGRVPIIAGCHHQNPYEVVKLCQHAESVGVDFAIILTPYQGAKSDDAVFDFYEFVSERVNIGIVLFNIPQVYYPISENLAKRLAALPNVCGFKQANPSPTATVNLRREIGNDLAVSVADEGPWLFNLAVMGDFVDYTVEQAKLATTVTEPEEFFGKRIENITEFAKVLEGRTKEYIGLWTESATAASEEIQKASKKNVVKAVKKSA